jgi:ADP-ribosylglycohydrolase
MLSAVVALVVTTASTIPCLAQNPEPPLEARIRGLLYGSAIGDALGGPIEFQTREAISQLPHPPKVWKPQEPLDEVAKSAARDRLTLRAYAPLRSASASYGQWGENAPAGTVTDDTRHKLVLLQALRQPGRLTAEGLAQAYLDWPPRPLPADRSRWLDDWLEEWRFASAWVLGDRRLKSARPPGRMWQGLPTCCGQMTSLPLAALHPGNPAQAYQHCYEVSFFDNGWGKDLNAALVAGLAQALVGPSDPRQAWDRIIAVMRATDPYHYGDIRYTTRQVDAWLDLALRLSREAEGKPERLFSSLEETFSQTIKWEAQVPFVVTFACLDLADYAPLVALQLSLEWGHDTDSYAQLVGAFIGAIHGDSLFPQGLRHPVDQRLKADFGVDLAEEARRLAQRSPVRTMP